MTDKDERRDAEVAFGDTLRAKLGASRPTLEDLMGRKAEDAEASDEGEQD